MFPLTGVVRRVMVQVLSRLRRLCSTVQEGYPVVLGLPSTALFGQTRTFLLNRVF